MKSQPWPAGLDLRHARFHGADLCGLADTYGTPVFLLDEDEMRGRARRWVKAMDKAFAGLAPARVFYAAKAFLSVGVARWMLEEGAGIDTCSALELRTALLAGACGERLGLHGNNKSEAEIQAALDAQVAHLVVDSLEELVLVGEIAQARGETAQIMLRITTGVHAGGHEYISTAHEDQKFGLSLASGMAHEAISYALAHPMLELRGFHSHIGSQILGSKPFLEAARKVLELRRWAWEKHQWLAEEIDFGGGFAVVYRSDDDAPLTPEEYASDIARIISEHCAETGLAAPEVSIEPGRSIAANPTCTIYSVGTVKDVPLATGSRRYVSVDGGMSDNIRPVLYGARYECALIRRNRTDVLEGAQVQAISATEQAEEMVSCRIVGKHCESGDILIEECFLPADIRRGDLLLIAATGAYGRSMASNYNMLTRPGVLALSSAHEPQWVLLPEREENLLALDPSASPLGH